MLKDQVQNDLKEAQLHKNEVVISTLRLLLSEIRYAEISKGKEAEDEDIVSVIQREIKKRKEAALGFRQGQREEQAIKEEAEARILEKYLPQQLSDEELTKIIEESMTVIGAKNIADMGKVIGMVMSKVKGQAEGGRVSVIVKEKLSQYD